MSENSEKKYKVVLVEDDENIAKLFTYNLKKAGYECVHGFNGLEGFDLVKSFKPDLIISDIMMPEVDGFQFRRMLMNEPELKSIPFIFLTAKGSEDDVLQGYDLDIQEYILKTASPKIVLAKLSAIIKSHEAERQKAQSEVQKAADTLGAKVVPDTYPSINNFYIEHWHVPFQNIPGGDFIDYVKIDEDKVAIVLGDVMGKKWGAWYFAVAYAGYVRSALRFVFQNGSDLSASQIMEKVNQSIFNDERIADVFITLSIVLLDSKTMTMNYCGAGDLPIHYFNGNEIKQIKSNGLLLGFSLQGGYEDVSMKLNPNDEIFLVTDGITESRNSEGEQFAQNGLNKAIISNPELGLSRIKDEFIKFTSGKYEDDVSIIYIKAK
jgi:sigma-B regulation protein RsbU (phosphoserine phosphatase)